MKYIISERQYKVLINEDGNSSDPSTYPKCVARYVGGGGFLSRKVGEIVTSKSGEQSVVIYSFSGYNFYNNGRVRKPDKTMTNYSCGTNGVDIIVDGVNLSQEKWQKEKGKYTTEYEKRELEKVNAISNAMTPSHTTTAVLQLATAFIPFVGPFISAGIGLADAARYYNEGDTKMAGLMGLFSIIPGIGGLATKLGLSNVGPKAMAEIGRKIGLGGKLTPAEMEIAKKVSANSALIQQSFKQKAKEVGVNVTKTVAGYSAAGAAYNTGYNTIQSNTPKIKAEKEGYNWEFVKASFGSTGSEQENNLLSQAWDKGWRPSKPVPSEYQTQLYKKGEELVAL